MSKSETSASASAAPSTSKSTEQPCDELTQRNVEVVSKLEAAAREQRTRTDRMTPI